MTQPIPPDFTPAPHPVTPSHPEPSPPPSDPRSTAPTAPTHATVPATAGHG
ncbi:hypothetical protein [Catenuloplanes atrovinosus]|uniref:Uncharacterized protein n=1 Tax=Catenuloplanes atrovinosus TaxID=137266 RepID=A0AAE3YUN2_9ACTN|nr:hypothetical protein [Catenuloplanes atrovinosus]MDR7280223.1 hypothetical protein [Catenuloplanes atrovinosus]